MDQKEYSLAQDICGCCGRFDCIQIDKNMKCISSTSSMRLKYISSNLSFTFLFSFNK